MKPCNFCQAETELFLLCLDGKHAAPLCEHCTLILQNFVGFAGPYLGHWRIESELELVESTLDPIEVVADVEALLKEGTDEQADE